MAKKLIIHPSNKQAISYARDLFNKGLAYGKPFEFILRYPTRSDRQNALYHALISDMARQLKHLGQDLPLEFWKAGLVDLFANEKEQMGEPLKHKGAIMPALDGSGRFISIRPSTTKFSVKEANEFIEFLFSYGAENGVRWGAKTIGLNEDFRSEEANRKTNRATN